MTDENNCPINSSKTGCKYFPISQEKNWAPRELYVNKFNALKMHEHNIIRIWLMTHQWSGNKNNVCLTGYIYIRYMLVLGLYMYYVLYKSSWYWPLDASVTVKTYLVVIIALMSFAFGVVLTIVIPAVYKRCRYPNYRHLQDLMEPSVTWSVVDTPHLSIRTTHTFHIYIAMPLFSC